MTKKKIALVIGACFMGFLGLLCVVGAVGAAMEDEPGKIIRVSPSVTVSRSAPATTVPTTTEPTTPAPTRTTTAPVTPTPSRTTTTPPIIGFKSVPKKAVANYDNCDEMRADYPTGVAKGHPAYKRSLDRDQDNRACEIN